MLVFLQRKEDFCGNMNVVVDSGNTYSKIGWFSGDNLIRFETRLSFTELIELIRAELPDRIMYSSVNRPLNEFLEALDRDVTVLNLTGVLPVPIEKDYETPHTLGADRVAAACGANWMFPGKDVLVVDMGTSITYDLLDHEGIFRGGLISLGVRMRFNALHTFTKRLPLFDPEKDPEFIGKSTKNAIQSGVMNGTLAEIEGIIDRYRNEIPSLCVVICGGDVPFFESSLKPPIFAVPELVLIGLNRILIYNVSLQ